MVVPLTGSTLRAALKWQCDATGAGYAVFWSRLGDQLVVAGDYTTDQRKAALRARSMEGSFAVQSENFAIALDTDDPVAECYQQKEGILLRDASKAEMSRADMAKKYRIAQIAFVPFEDGVMEFGTSDSSETTTWPNDFTKIPKAPVFPKDEVRNAYELIGASYTMFWSLSASRKEYTIKANHVTTARRAALKQVRGDDKTFCSESTAFKIPAEGQGPIATAARTGETVVVDDVSTMKRAALAQEFQINKFRFVPVEGGVLEYGVPSTLSLDSNLLEATLKLRVDTSGAAYALYWKETNGQFTVAGSFLPPARELALVKAGRAGLGYAKASENVTLDANGDGPVARCYRGQEPIFIRDASGANLKRASLVREFGIASIVFSPAEGGVIEYGTSLGSETAEWQTVDDAGVDAIPRGELRKAFAEGANELIFWKRVGDKYVVRGDYVIPERLRALRQSRGDEESYASRSEELFSSFIDAYGTGPIATAQRGGIEVIIKDAASATNFKRKALAQEFGVENVHFVPLDDGAVLEYGRGGVAQPPAAGEEPQAATGVVTPSTKSGVGAAVPEMAMAGAQQAMVAQVGASTLQATPVQAAPSPSGGMELTQLDMSANELFDLSDMDAAAILADQQFSRVRQLNKYAKLDLDLRRAQDNIRTLRGAATVSRRATLIAPLVAISAISIGQYVTQPGFDFPGLDDLKAQWRLQTQIRFAEQAAETAADIYFPGHLSGGRIDHLVWNTLKKMGYTAENTLFATSVCPDEVNAKKGEVDDILSTRYGEYFSLGGLGGIPFTGIPGFTAYSHHVPDNLSSPGKMLVLFAPHVGIQSDGTVGKLKRSSQKGISTACGAAVGAYKSLQSDEAKSALAKAVAEEEAKGSDAQFAYIKEQLKRRLDGIENAPDPTAFVTYQMYCIMREFFVSELKKAPTIWDYAGELTVLGGIQINRDVGGDRFMPLMFQTRRQAENSNRDLFPETFGSIRDRDLRYVLGLDNEELGKNFNRGKYL